MSDSAAKTRRTIEKGDAVRFRAVDSFKDYAAMYRVTLEDVFEVSHVESRGSREVIYLSLPGREAWIPAWPSSLLLVRRGPVPTVSGVT